MLIESKVHNGAVEPTRKALFIRVDRIGDLVLTLPVDQLVKFNVTWLVAQGLEFILESSSNPRSFHTTTKDFTIARAMALYHYLAKEKFDIAVVFHAPWWISMVLFLARVPIRVGRWSQWHSFLFLNRGFRQKRSRSEVHESEYNFKLLESFLGESLKARPLLEIKNQKADAITDKLGLLKKSYFVVHPGMAGSARNVNTPFYVDLIKQISVLHPVVITGTMADAEYIFPIKAQLGTSPNVLWLNEKLSSHEMIAILQNARAVVAPSTGIIHLAASTGTQAIGLYSPVTTQHATRWGPRGKFTYVFSPKVKCPGTKDCLFQECPIFDCMDQIKVSDVVTLLQMKPM